MSSRGGVTNVRWKKKGKGILFVDKMSTILEDKHVRKKRGHICPEDTLRTILIVKKWTFFLGVLKNGTMLPIQEAHVLIIEINCRRGGGCY